MRLFRRRRRQPRKADLSAHLERVYWQTLREQARELPRREAA
jgi:hypothetical protein